MTTAASGELTSGVRPSEQSAHTPGPWTACFMTYDRKVTGFHISAAPHGSTKPICETRFTHEPHEGMEANAHLIAAAPAMRDALLNVRKIIADAAMTGFNWKDGDWVERLFASQAVTSDAILLAAGTKRNNRDAEPSNGRE